MPVKLAVTKLDAARRQFETAITLWFHHGEPISIHTLVGAGHRIVLDLLERDGKTAVPFDMTYVSTGQEKEFKKLMRDAETFLI